MNIKLDKQNKKIYFNNKYISVGKSEMDFIEKLIEFTIISRNNSLFLLKGTETFLQFLLKNKLINEKNGYFYLNSFSKELSIISDKYFSLSETDKAYFMNEEDIELFFLTFINNLSNLNKEEYLRLKDLYDNNNIYFHKCFYKKNKLPMFLTIESEELKDKIKLSKILNIKELIFINNEDEIEDISFIEKEEENKDMSFEEDDEIDINQISPELMGVEAEEFDIEDLSFMFNNERQDLKEIKNKRTKKEEKEEEENGMIDEKIFGVDPEIILEKLYKDKKNKLTEEQSNKIREIQNKYKNKKGRNIKFKTEQKKILNNPEKYLILDTETTGISSTDEVIKLSIIDLSGNILIDEFFKTDKISHKKAFEKHNIKTSDLLNKKTFKSRWNKIKRIIEDKILIIFNENLDTRLLEQTCVLYDIKRIPLKSVCALKMSIDETGFKSMKSLLDSFDLAVNEPMKNSSLLNCFGLLFFINREAKIFNLQKQAMIVYEKYIETKTNKIESRKNGERFLKINYEIYNSNIYTCYNVIYLKELIQKLGEQL